MSESEIILLVEINIRNHFYLTSPQSPGVILEQIVPLRDRSTERGRVVAAPFTHPGA
jgi:hypothetical protein